MKRFVIQLLLISDLLLTNFQAKAQSLYFPPTTGSTWDTLSPQSLNWCPDHINQLSNFLDAKLVNIGYQCSMILHKKNDCMNLQRQIKNIEIISTLTKQQQNIK